MSVPKVLFRELNKYVKRFLREGMPLTGIAHTAYRAEELTALSIPKAVFRDSPDGALDSETLYHPATPSICEMDVLKLHL